jgi:hypothetical protein
VSRAPRLKPLRDVVAVGTGVAFDVAGETMRGRVVEDLGARGASRKRLYVIAVDGSFLELPASTLRADPDAVVIAHRPRLVTKG